MTDPRASVLWGLACEEDGALEDALEYDADRPRAIGGSMGSRLGRRRLSAGAPYAREQEVAQLVAAGDTPMLRLPRP